MTVAAASATLVAHIGRPRCTSAAFGCIPRASTRETALEKRRRVQCPMLREDARRAREQLRKGETEKAGRKTGRGRKSEENDGGRNAGSRSERRSPIIFKGCRSTATGAVPVKWVLIHPVRYIQEISTRFVLYA